MDENLAKKKGRKNRLTVQCISIDREIVLKLNSWNYSGFDLVPWADCEYSFGRALEQQYQSKTEENELTFHVWNSSSKSYIPEVFAHNLAKMTQLNKTTQVQKPIRRMLLSDPVSPAELKAATPATPPAEDPTHPVIPSVSSTHLDPLGLFDTATGAARPAVATVGSGTAVLQDNI